MFEPYTSGSIGAAKNDNSGLAGLEIYLGASKGRPPYLIEYYEPTRNYKERQQL